MRFQPTTATFICCMLANSILADEPLFSGPQVGEPVIPFEAKGVFGDHAGKTISVLQDPKAKSPKPQTVQAPTLIVFVHRVTRPALGLTRMVLNYANTKRKAGMQSQLVFLTNDPTDTQALLRRARNALPKEVPPLISVDGADGPGAYGLNRKMTLTVLVANQGKVTANFPLIQPSIQADGPKIGQAIAAALGEKKPTLQEMGYRDRRMNMRKQGLSAEKQATYRRMMSSLLRKTATSEQVQTAAEDIEDYAMKHIWFQEKVHQASNLIINGGKLSNYGTPEAQGFLKKWSKEFAPKADMKREAKSASQPIAKANETPEQANQQEKSELATPAKAD